MSLREAIRLRKEVSKGDDVPQGGAIRAATARNPRSVVGGSVPFSGVATGRSPSRRCIPSGASGRSAA